MSQVATTGVNGSVLSDADRLFATLDGLRVSNGLAEWNSRIQGIYADGPYYWLQLSRDEAQAQSVVVRFARDTAVLDMVHALESVRFDDDASIQVLRIPHRS